MSRILVVGCGPTGLTVAGLLRAHGVEVTLIDKYPGVLKATKAAAIHARTLEVLDALRAGEAAWRTGRLLCIGWEHLPRDRRRTRECGGQMMRSGCCGRS